MQNFLWKRLEYTEYNRTQTKHNQLKLIFIQNYEKNEQIQKNKQRKTINKIQGDKQEKFSLDTNQLLLRGATLKNTPWVIGVVCYAGKEQQKKQQKKQRKKWILKIEIFKIFNGITKI